MDEYSIHDDDDWKAEPPTRDQIRQRCLEIQAGWTDDERLQRANLGHAAHRLTPDAVQHGKDVERIARAALRRRGMK